MSEVPEVGIHRDVPFGEYLQWDAINNSSLRPLERSIAHYLAALDNPHVANDSMLFGTLAHAGKLEPLSIVQRFVVMPAFEKEIRREDGTPYDNPRATKAYKELVAAFQEANQHRQIVDQADYDRMVGLVAAVQENERAREYLCQEGQIELSIVWVDPITGLLCKGRLDHWNEGARRATDFKTTASMREFAKSLVYFGYARQAAFYFDGLSVLGLAPKEFCIVAAESEPPFGVMGAPVSDTSLSWGRVRYRQALAQIKQFRSTGEVTGYESPDAWDVPEWAFSSELVLTKGGLTLARL